MPHSTTTTTAATTTTVPTKTVNDTQVPLAPLETISYQRIRSNDPAEQERLRQVCQHPGFYYVDFRGDEAGEAILADLTEAYQVEEKYFGEHQDPNRMKDIEIKHDALPSVPTLPAPLQPHLPLLTRLSNNLRAANLALLSAVSSSSSSELKEAVQRHHLTDSPSKTALDLIYAPTKPLAKDAPDTTHTDEGTMTILFNGDWGLRVEDPVSREWGWVEPREGCALVNVGDWLGRASKEHHQSQNGGGVGVHSCRHAVSQVGDGVVKRFYVVHYLRPALEVN